MTPWVLLFLLLPAVCLGNMLIPGIMSEEVELNDKTQEYLGFLQSALNQTEVEIRIKCEDDSDLEFEAQFAIRSSPCAKEFIVDKRRFSQVSNLLAFYFEEEYQIPAGYHYDKILFLKSKAQRYSCKNSHGIHVFMEQTPKGILEVHNVTEYGATQSPVDRTIRRTKREAFPGLNGDSIDGGARMSLTSWHPAMSLPVDSIYLLIVKLSVVQYPKENPAPHKIQVEVQWRGPHGYLSAIDYPLLHFYGFMCAFYIALAFAWSAVCIKYWKDLLRIQFWIGAVILIGMVEKAVFYAEYTNMNETGQSVEGLIEMAELSSCLKRTMAHVLVIIVAVGYGVTKPRLGSILNQVVATGVVYFVFCAIEGLTRVSKATTEAMKEKQIAKFPLAVLEIVIAWWIFSSLVSTMRALRMRRNEVTIPVSDANILICLFQVKLNLYRHFTNVLGMALGVAVLYMMWSLWMHIFQYCMSDWKELWVDTAFWHIFFCTILVVIMFLWRPSQNNQRYAFTPLLDNSEDENDEDELFDASHSKATVYDMVKQRGAEKGEAGAKPSKDVEEDLNWIDRHIPATLAEALMDDDEEEKEQRQLEYSKML
ncbi:Protein C52B9.4 [Aphelenchoides avenae]|nr:Protein C52B9.4 [Aphelenchus avenae]